jgi:DNA-binding winged helix-turn-helix (wHTH) protein
MSLVAPKSILPHVASQTPSPSNEPGGHPLRSMVIASKRFGPREWFVIHPAEAGPDAGVADSLQELRAPLVVPIIVVAGTAAERDRIVNDLARYIEGSKRAAAEQERPVIQIDELRVDPHAHRASVNDEEVTLTNLEFRLLLALIERRDRVQSRGALLQEVWGLSANSTTRTVDTHVKRLRDKLRGAGRFLQSVRGIGYRFSQSPVPHDSGTRVDGQPRVAPPLSAGTARGRQPVRSLVATP